MKHNKKQETMKINTCKNTDKQDKMDEKRTDKQQRKTKELRAKDDVQMNSDSKKQKMIIEYEYKVID